LLKKFDQGSGMKKQIRLLILLALWVEPTFAFKSIKGPNFYNATNDPLTLEVTFDSGRQWRGDTKMTMKAHMHFADLDDHQVNSVTFIAEGKTYRLETDVVLKLRGGTRPRDQLWVFDGASVCLLPERGFDPKKDVQCEAAEDPVKK
jgi:hypothetical protein